MSATITVRRIGEAEPLAFEVGVQDEKSESRHRVTLSQNDFQRLNAGGTVEKFVEAAFRFLLDREPKESILRRFDVSVISRYFPEFEQEIRAYLQR